MYNFIRIGNDFMNKKGFTLVELLAVIVILGLLIAIISPVVKNLLNDSKDSLSEQQKKLVVEATKKYMIENSELLPEGSNRAIVYMSDLIDKGVIDNDKIIDPKSKGEINGCVVVSYNNEFNQYDYNYSENENDCLITVTFDPEGGSVDTTSKQVKFNSIYGELPTPTREGYTFKGWRGKNMLKLAGRSERNPGGSFYDTSKRNFTGDGIYVGITSNNYYLNTNVKDYEIDDLNNIIKVISNGSGYGVGFDLKVTSNTQYTVSSTSPCNIRLGQYQEDGTFITWNSATASQFKLNETFTTSNDTYWLLFTAATAAAKPIEYTNVQIEKGDTATEFEPYQEYSSDTVVTKSSNHTLHAIWEVAS